jgi:flotillin
LCLFLRNKGLTVVSYTVKDIEDEYEYLRSLGEACTANVKKDAMVSETEALKETQLKQTEADEMKQSSALRNKIKMAQSHFDFREKKFTYDKEVREKIAEADFAAELQRVETRNQILKEKLKVQLEESRLQVELARNEMERTKSQFQIDVHKLADAEYRRAQILAEAHKDKVKVEAKAEADAVRMRGIANAYMIEKTGIAENEMLARKADVLKEFNAAARMDMILEALPKVAAEIAEPLSRCSKITMVSQGDGEIGASKLTNEILEIMHKVHHTVEKMGSQSAAEFDTDDGVS